MSGEETENKRFWLVEFLDLRKVPCARESFLYGAGGGVTAGLLHFLFTSRVRRSYDVGFAGFAVTTLGSWIYCRINNAKLRMMERVIQQGIHNKVLYEGTGLDPNKQEEALQKHLETQQPGPPKNS